MTIKEMHMVLHRNLGPFGTTAIGLGEMPLTIENNLGHDKGIETIHAALDAGCRHLDTAWAYYCSGGEEQTGEKLIREAMASWNGPKDEVTIATKVGHFRNFTDGRPTWDVDGRPENLIKRGKESALALGVDTIDLLYFHRPDPKVPYNESVEAIKQLVDEGVAQEAGISNASIEQIDIAASASPRTKPSSTRSARSRRLVASPTSRSCSRGSSPRATMSSSSPAPTAPRPSSTACMPAIWSSPPTSL